MIKAVVQDKLKQDIKGVSMGGRMGRKHNANMIPFAKELRNNPTKEERKLWYDFLHNYPVRFQRQKVIGRYIADFYCARANLVIELDGSQHYSDEGERRDEIRTSFLEGYNLTVIRIPNNEVSINFDGVCEFIDRTVRERCHGRESC